MTGASAHHGIFPQSMAREAFAMHRRVSTILHRLRHDLTATLGTDSIHAACVAAGHTWSAAALLTPAAIIHWSLIQILHGNTSLTHVSLLAGRAFSAAALCM